MIVWRVRSSVLGSTFHLEDTLEEVYLFKLCIIFSHLHPVTELQLLLSLGTATLAFCHFCIFQEILSRLS